jgi:hypothetical protein
VLPYSGRPYPAVAEIVPSRTSVKDALGPDLKVVRGWRSLGQSLNVCLVARPPQLAASFVSAGGRYVVNIFWVTLCSFLGAKPEVGMNRELMAKQLAQAALASRADIVRYLEKARRDGKLGEVISWRSRLKKIDRRIAQYGLERYATRP